MSTPSIPGYLNQSRRRVLADLWNRPSGEYPEELWPVSVLREITPAPAGWLVVEEYFHNDARHGGTGCVLVRPDDQEKVLSDSSWSGRSLGQTSVWDGGRFEDGLRTVEQEVEVSFFVQARTPIGAPATAIEIFHPFLWYWDAYLVQGGARYLSSAGREQELVRWTVDGRSWRVEVRALEFRQFLAVANFTAVMQVDVTTKTESDEFERVDDEFQNDWSYFTYFAVHDSTFDSAPAFSGVMGKYLVEGVRGPRMPRWEEWSQDREYPDFIYGQDEETGELKLHSCNPDKLGTYYDKDDSRLHYLTPVYFKREVLQPYTSQPNRYKVSASRLTCLNLWGVDIGLNSVGLVEMYLGDIGQKLPAEDWGHWKSYNVPPEGEMDEGRFRRDFLNQPATSIDPVRDLQQARQRAADTSAALYGSPIWRPLEGQIRVEFEALYGPLTNDPSSLSQPLLTVTKALVDAIDSRLIKRLIPEFQPNDQSLRLLTLLTESLGDEHDIVDLLRNLQGFRSRGGVAHLAGSQRSAAEASLGIAGLEPWAAFESIVVRATQSLNVFSDLVEAKAAATTDGAPS